MELELLLLNNLLLIFSLLAMVKGRPFYTLHANAILFEVSDDSYQPTYQLGDMLGAVQTSQKNLGNMDVVILEGKDRVREIKRILATKDNALF